MDLYSPYPTVSHYKVRAFISKTLINFVFRKLDTDIKRNNRDNTDKNLQVWWNQPKYIVLETYEISYFQKKKGLLQLMGQWEEWQYFKEKKYLQDAVGLILLEKRM